MALDFELFDVFLLQCFWKKLLNNSCNSHDDKINEFGWMGIEFSFPEARLVRGFQKSVEFVKSGHCSDSWNTARSCSEVVDGLKAQQQLQFREAHQQPFRPPNRTLPFRIRRVHDSCVCTTIRRLNKHIVAGLSCNSDRFIVNYSQLI